MKHDSKLEQSVGYTKIDYYLPATFFDKTGQVFAAKADYLFYDPDRNKFVFVELKGEELNSITTIQSSENQLCNQAHWRRLDTSGSWSVLSHRLWEAGYQNDCLSRAWNHSLYKHQIVSNELKEAGYDYIVVFKKHPPTVKYRKKQMPYKLYYGKKGIRAMLKSEFDELVDAKGWIERLSHK